MEDVAKLFGLDTDWSKSNHVFTDSNLRWLFWGTLISMQTGDKPMSSLGIVAVGEMIEKNGGEDLVRKQ